LYFHHQKLKQNKLQKDIPSDIIKLIAKAETREKAFRMILSSYKERVYWLVRRIVIVHDDADDVVQNTFIKVWENLANYRGDANIYTWLYRIAVNEALAFLKKKKRQNLNLTDYGEVLTANLQSDVFFDGNDFQKKLQMALLRLPEQQRLVFNLKYFDEMKYKDMAKVLDRSEGALKANYHHAVKKIEDFVKNA
jgi:RNA polymerase sigma-70 factor (ECF subfamily)